MFLTLTKDRDFYVALNPPIEDFSFIPTLIKAGRYEIEKMDNPLNANWAPWIVQGY